MAFDAFMYFPMQASIVGEVQDQAMKAKNAFAIKSFEFGAENKIDIGSDTEGGAAGKATFKEFTIKKKTDTASCGLFHALCEGKHLTEGIIELRRSGGAAGASGATFMKFHFKLVMVQDLGWSGADGDDVCEEDLIFQYGAMKIEYFRQGADGKMKKAQGGQGEVKWSRVKNAAVYDI